MDTISIKRDFISNNSKITKFQKKIDHLDKNKQFRLRELKEVVPKEREALKEKAKELYDLSDYYREKGYPLKYQLYQAEASRKIKSLKAISRFRKQKEIHLLNRNIREIESRIQPLREDRMNQESTIKEILFKEFLQCGKVI